MQNKELGFTGERFIPGIEDVKLETEHYQRYLSVRNLVSGKTVLDAACGEGYGSNILADAALQVYGIDIDEDTVSRAREKYGSKKDNLIYQVGSIASLFLEDSSVDVVVSFETIEHVDGEIQESFLKEIKRVLKPDGVLIMSTPNKEIYSDRYQYQNEFHIKEFYYEEFVDFLKQEFNNIRFYAQSFQIVSLISDLRHTDNMFHHFGEEADAVEAKYYIAIASNGNIDNDFDMASVYTQKGDEYENLIQRVLTLQKEENIRNEHIVRLDKEIEQKNTDIISLQERLKNQEAAYNLQIESLRNQEPLHNALIESLKERIQRQDSVMEEQSAMFKKYSDLIDRQDKLVQRFEEQFMTIGHQLQEQLVAELQNKLAEAEKETARRGEHIRKQDEELAYLREYRLSAEREFQSKTYRLSYKFRQISKMLLPLGSTRRSVVAVFGRILRHPARSFRIFKSGKIKNITRIIRTEGWQGLHYRYVNAEREETMAAEAQNASPSEKEIPVNKDFKEYAPLYFEAVKNPEVSIIIPVYNQFEYTYRCLESILQNSSGIAYEIIITDDNSRDDTRRMEEIVHNIVKVTNKENLRFLKNCNHAAQRAKGEFLLFLNNDTQVQENWLQPMLRLLKENKDIGMTGAKLIYADGRLQEAGGIVWKDGSAWNYGNCQNPEKAEFNYVKDVDFISGACIMIRRSLWEEIGGFDEALAPAYYEDVDLAFEVRKRGYRVVYQPMSVVVHYEGISNGTDLKTGQKAYQEVNSRKFYEKWKATLEKDHFENGREVFLARDRSRYQKHILVVDHYVPHFDKDAGGRGTFMYLKLFREMGMHVTFIGDNFYKHEPYTTLLNQEGIEILYGAEYMNTYERWIKEHGQYFDYAYLQRPHITVKYIDLVREYTDAKIIYYDVDLVHVRELRQYDITKEKALLKSAKKWKKLEFELIDKADVVHVVGSYEEQYLKRVFPGKPIRNIPLFIYSDIKRDVNKDFVQRQNILFVGGFGHPPNEDAVLWFAENVFPGIVKKHPDIKWYIVGGNPPQSVQELANNNIVVKGFVSDEELNRLYSECRMAVVPLRYGAGVKGKVLEAIYNQIPLVTTSVGAEGLSKEENAYWLADGAEEMQNIILETYDNPQKLMEKSENCKNFILNHFTIDEAKRVLALDF